MAKTGIVVFVPAYNEEKNIQTAVAQLVKLRKAGEIDHILVVDDGSTDRTARLAKDAGADTVLRFARNQGKAMAFFEAVNYYYRRHKPVPNILVTFDADIKGINRRALRKMVRPVRRLRTSMTNANVPGFNIEQTGQRAIKFDLLKPILFRKDIQARLFGGMNDGKRMRTGYGLEEFLNFYFTRGKLRHTNVFTKLKSTEKPRGYDSNDRESPLAGQERIGSALTASTTEVLKTRVKLINRWSKAKEIRYARKEANGRGKKSIVNKEYLEEISKRKAKEIRESIRRPRTFRVK